MQSISFACDAKCIAIKQRDTKEKVSLTVSNLIFGALLIVCVLLFNKIFLTAQAENFTDLFYTQSLRGTFSWIRSFDFIGAIVQFVISMFSILGAIFVILRIMTSILYKSAPALWDEVSDLKSSSGGESQYFDFGMVNMAKTWAKGKAGTGFDAIFGAVLLLLPDIKRYSDFGPNAKSGINGNLEDMSISQYMLKGSLQWVMILFFCAMGFNGTLWQAFGTTIDTMGAIMDKAVNVNYVRFIDDALSKMGGKFYFDQYGTDYGDFLQGVAKTVYGKAVSAGKVDPSNSQALSAISTAVSKKIKDTLTETELTSIGKAQKDTATMKELSYDVSITSEKSSDNYPDNKITDNKAMSKMYSFSLEDLGVSNADTTSTAPDGKTETKTKYINVIIRRDKQGSLYF